MPDIEEDLKLARQECTALKAENVELRKKVEDIDTFKLLNEQLTKQLKEQEVETVKAMKAIGNQIELDTQKVVKLNKEDSESLSNKRKEKLAVIENQYKKKIADLKQENDNIMEEMVKLQGEKDIEREKIESIAKKDKIEKNLKLFNVLVANGHELTELPLPEAEHNKDECIESIHCAGDCEKVSQIKRLNSMK